MDLRKLLPGFKKKSKTKVTRAPAQVAPVKAAETGPLVKPVAVPPPARMQVNPSEMLAVVISWLREYLVCDDHQLVVLALWTVYTWCHHCFPTAVYLYIRSPQSQSGKTRCHDLLERVSAAPCRINGGK
ncbi:MAG TPA: hypothetical protein VI685_09215, partial [Candidatus Angelobacter sp.]